MESYYYVDASNKAAGPYDLAALVAQGINASTLVWKAGLSSWVPAAQVPEVAAALKAASQPTAAAASQTVNEPRQAPGASANAPHVRPDEIPEAPANENAEPPRDYLVWAILSTVFCCGGFSVSVAGLVMAILTRVFNAKGKYETSRIFSRLALYFTIGGAVLMALYLAIVFSLGLTSAALYDF